MAGTTATKDLISVLPSEILMHIFDIYCPFFEDKFMMNTLDAEDWNEIGHKKLMLLRLCSISRRWRAIVATSMPALWSQLVLHWTFQGNQLLLSQVAPFLERSASCPIHIDINCRIYQGHYPSHADELITLLIPHHARWKPFTCFTPRRLLLDPDPSTMSVASPSWKQHFCIFKRTAD
ncbi:hypothetical protein HGRIS_011458 [Hohenbuehelia grisea]|uniref:F-box domain-containing protein n=1 Tax=Hohenbuehelia grisea TaxID=104357 RepID=A0ABR3JWW2_9AGAR